MFVLFFTERTDKIRARHQRVIVRFLSLTGRFEPDPEEEVCRGFQLCARPRCATCLAVAQSCAAPPGSGRNAERGERKVCFVSSKRRCRTTGVYANPVSPHRAASSDSFKEQRGGPRTPARLQITPPRERRLVNTRHPFNSSPFSFEITVYKCNRYAINWLNRTSIMKTYLLE